jgi:hypothetical protein
MQACKDRSNTVRLPALLAVLAGVADVLYWFIASTLTNLVGLDLVTDFDNHTSSLQNVSIILDGLLQTRPCTS